MRVTVIDISRTRTTFENAKISLSDKTLMIHAPNEKGETVLYNFVLQNVICYIAVRDSNEEKE